jgi:receptor protein-tyrosine kinase
MASDRAAEIFAELSRDPRRIIVVDTAPAIGSAEAAALAMHMHHTLLVVGAQQSSRHQVEEALERISSCRSVSMVFNKSPRWRKAGSAYYQYYGHKPLAA